MTEEELEALPVLSVVIDTDGDAWQKKGPGWWTLAPAHEWEFELSDSAALARHYPDLIPIVPATDSGAQRLAELRKAVT